MFKQGNFIAPGGFFPANILKNLDANVGPVPVPGCDRELEARRGRWRPRWHCSAATTPAPRQFLKFMLTPTFGTSAAKLAVTSHRSRLRPQADYPNNLTRQMANIAYKATSFAFDASDADAGGRRFGHVLDAR